MKTVPNKLTPGHTAPAGPAPSKAPSLTLYSPAGVVTQPAALRRAAKRLKGLGFAVTLDDDALARHQRFAGDDATRVAAMHRVARAAPSVALASRGGYGLSRIHDQLDWKLLAKSVDRGTKWVGMSDLTTLSSGLLAHALRTGRSLPITWMGPLACDHFGRLDEDGGVDETTRDCFLEAMDGSLEAVGFSCGAGHDGLVRKGTLWGGNLCVLNGLIGTPCWPDVRGGILMVEDVNEHPYRVERNLLQLLHAGVIDKQRAVLLGHFTAYKPSAHDRGFNLKRVVEHLRERTKTPILTGLPFGHVPTVVSLPIGAQVTLAVQGRQAFVGWGHAR
jgi:muramoyltetrapeptide carboxypeptidase